MFHKKIELNDTAFVEAYIPDPIISYKVNRKWPAVVICPGGGYMISAIKEGEAVAMQFLSQGYACFVLRYSTFVKSREAYSNELAEINANGYYPSQILELMETLFLIKENSEEWFIDNDHVFTMGFSAGAHIVAMEAFRWNEDELISKLEFVPKSKELKPRGSILCYPMLNARMDHFTNSELSKFQKDMMNKCLHKSISPTFEQCKELEVENYLQSEIPELFIWHTTEDTVTNAKYTTSLVKKIQDIGRPCEYHLFRQGRHGLACGNKHYANKPDDINISISMWLPLVFNWMGEI
ncbi:alpha/beta hydrolase [Enterococcus sp. DIV0170]|uniref:alpha/beta hydrolase n=1 Tax=Enterococcus sp. DIV0170 TaxID=2774642 RepID=UPI003F23BDCC